MSAQALAKALKDFARWCEGDELLHFRFRPGSTVEPGPAVVDWIKIDHPAGQSFSVGVMHGRLVAERVWYEGTDAWDAAGRPNDPELMPRLTGVRGAPRPLDGSDPAASALAEAVLALHRSYVPGPGKLHPDDREPLADRIEAAMRSLSNAELAAAGVPSWLLADAPEEEAAGPRP